jgi:hypothetical protein
MFCEKARKRSGHIGTIVPSINTLIYRGRVCELAFCGDRSYIGKD